MAKNNIVWLPHHLEWIETNQFGRPRKELLELLKATFNDLDPRLKQYHVDGLCRKNRWLNGSTGRLEKGMTPWNKGTKGVCKASKSSFKKGHRPPSARPVGANSLDHHGYVVVKIAEPRTWQLKHLWLWEQYNGKVPDGHLIRFIDGDKYNITIDNLICVPRAVNGYLNRRKIIEGHNPDLNKALFLTHHLNYLVKRKPHETQTTTHINAGQAL